MTRLLFCFLAAGMAVGLAGCGALEPLNKKPKFTVSFHAQAGEAESPRSIFRFPVPGHQGPMVFKRVPEFTQENVSAFYSFPATNGNGYGVTLRLDFRGTNALDLMTRTHTGEVVLAVVNGVPVDYPSIDRPVSDGVVTIWEGITEPVLKLMKAKWPPINKLKSMSSGQEMLPTTRAEKRRSQAAIEAQMKAEDQKARTDAAKPRSAADPQAPQTSTLPAGTPTSQIPLEVNSQDQPLPQIKR
ncbi:MAG: hypothetical protein JWO94_2429 [Verrucomicrobiaceae bacterium]|nr:hypothetical protein [Verrucomicrobiaceae bacterium]